MFERYDVPARRVIFFACLAARQQGAPAIEPEHILLGLLREDDSFFQRLAIDGTTIRALIKAQLSQNKSASHTPDLPLAKQTQRVLATAAEESRRLKHSQVNFIHLLFGAFVQTGSIAHEAMALQGLTEERLREELAKQN